MLKMQFAGQVAGVATRILLDSGANMSFISKAFVADAHLGTKASHLADVMLPDGQKCPVHGTVKVHVKIQGYQGQVTLHVIDMNVPFECILGDDWLRSRNAVLNYQDGYVLAWNRKQCCKLSVMPLAHCRTADAHHDD